MARRWSSSRYWIVAAILIAAVFGVVLFLRSDRGVSSVTLGQEEVVFDYSAEACDRLDIPDTPARAFRDAGGMVQMLASHHVTRRFIGPDLDHLTRDCRVVMSSHEDPRPEQFDDREWIAALHTDDGSRIAALVHNEYQGHRHEGQCPSESYRRCWYNSITLATSQDGGHSFTHVDAPNHLVATIPRRYQPDDGPQGVFSASNIVRSPRDGFYYSMFQLVSDEYGSGSCLMRTRDPFDASSWRAWDGQGFRLRFVDPYRTRELPKKFCGPVSAAQIGTMRHSLTFNTHLDQFLLVGVAQAWDPVSRRDVPGIYYALSDDLIAWSERKLVMEAELPWTFECGDPAPINYPSLLDPSSPSRTFDVSSERGYLYFTRLNYPNCDARLDRDLIRIPVTFSKEGP
jgi:hypothetical protein